MFDFYRIEKNGVGPYIYSDENDFHWMEYNHHDCEFTPPIDDDQGFSVNERFIYNYNARKKDVISGFASLSDLHNWFSPKELKSLISEGFEVKHYIVSNLYDSGLQAFILKTDIVCVNSNISFKNI